MNEQRGWHRIYYPLNLAMAGYGIYVLLLPFLSPLMERVFPSIWECAYYRFTGQPCPLCGVTRDLSSTFSGQEATLNPASLSIFAFVVGSLFYRVWATFSLRKLTVAKQKLLFVGDAMLHLSLLALLVFKTLYSQS